MTTSLNNHSIPSTVTPPLEQQRRYESEKSSLCERCYSCLSQAFICFNPTPENEPLQQRAFQPSSIELNSTVNKTAANSLSKNTSPYQHLYLSRGKLGGGFLF